MTCIMLNSYKLLAIMFFENEKRFSDVFIVDIFYRNDEFICSICHNKFKNSCIPHTNCKIISNITIYNWLVNHLNIFAIQKFRNSIFDKTMKRIVR